jgi:hypothetical protein
VCSGKENLEATGGTSRIMLKYKAVIAEFQTGSLLSTHYMLNLFLLKLGIVQYFIPYFLRILTGLDPLWFFCHPPKMLYENKTK